MNRSDKARLGREFPLLYRIIFLIVLSAVLLSIAEVALRLFGPDVRAVQGLVEVVNDPRSFALTANKSILFAGLREPLVKPVYWVINDQRIRANHSISPVSHKFRVATFGDSEAFGWGVDFEDTFQKQMELIDNRVEVINFGVPGYNVTNIAASIEQTAAQFHPDLLIYMVHENDFDDPLEVGALVARSRLLLLAKFAYYKRFLKPREMRLRTSDERMERFVQQIDRITQFCKRNNIALALAFFEWENRHAMLKHAKTSRGSVPLAWQQRQSWGIPRYFNLNPIIIDAKKVDRHFAKGSYRKIAGFLCESIRGEQSSGCVPQVWQQPEKSTVQPSPMSKP